MLENAKTMKGSHATLAALGLVVLIGALLRFHNLGDESLWRDEVSSWTQARGSFTDLIKQTANDNYPPLHNLALFAAINLFGDSEWSLRLPSAIFGVVNIIALYWLGTMTVGRTAGLVGAALLCLSKFHLTYSQEARMYSLLALAATLYAATCFHYLRTPSLQRGAWVSLTGLALLYSHPYGALDWVTIAVAFAVLVLPSSSPPPRTTLVWMASNAVAAAGFAPWALILAYRVQLIKEVYTLGGAPLAAAEVLPRLKEVVMGWGDGPLSTLFGSVILIGVILGVIGRLRRDVAVLCLWTLGPVAVGIAASILWEPVLLSRYIIGSLPPLLLLSGFGWTRYAKGWRGASLLTAVVIAVSVIAGSARLWSLSYWVKDDIRGLASFLDEREKPTDCVLVVADNIALPLGYYRRNSSCQWVARKVADLPAEMRASILFGVFALSGWGDYEPDIPAFVDELRRRGWRDLDRADFRGVRVVTFSR
jgi:mannosyltransferase